MYIALITIYYFLAIPSVAKGKANRLLQVLLKFNYSTFRSGWQGSSILLFVFLNKLVR